MKNKAIILLIFIIVIIAVIGIVLAVRNSGEENTTANNVNTEESNNEENQVIENANEIQGETINNETTNSNRVLVAVFSQGGEVYNVGNVEVGNTMMFANKIVDHFGDNADLFHITTVEPYPESYDELTEVAREQLDSNARPEIQGQVDNFEQYDTIFIGYPIWWGEIPPAVSTFLESYDFIGKTVIPFNTHEGSGSSGTYQDIADALSNANVNTNGLAIRGTDAREESSRNTIENWLQELGY